jgi:hypothetical protein
VVGLANDRYLLDSVTIPLYKGAMKMQTRRVRSLIPTTALAAA